MIEIVRDSAWQFAGFLLGLLTLAISLFMTWKHRQQRAISYYVLSTPLVDVHPDVAGDVEIRFLGIPVSDVKSVWVNIWNSGTVPVPRADFEQPISFVFEKDTKVLHSTVVSTEPAGIPAVMTNQTSSNYGGLSSSAVHLSPVLLNPGDSIAVSLLVSGSAELSLITRVIGLKGLSRQDPLTQTHQSFFWGLRPVLIFGIVIFSVIFAIWLSGGKTVDYLNALALASVVASLYFGTAWLSKWAQDK